MSFYLLSLKKIYRKMLISIFFLPKQSREIISVFQINFISEENK